MKKLLTLVLTVVALGMTALPANAAGEWTKYRIMLDPGHGGTDPGASGPTAPHEAELALACATKLNEFITTNLGGTVKLTRSTNTSVSLSARKSASVSYDPYIFCSIHLNAFNGTANGTETWYYHSTGNSKNLANRVHNTLISQMGRTNRGVKQNGWTVITGSASVPAILTEGLFVDNKTEHDLIKDKKGTGFLNWVRGHLYGYYTHLKAIAGTSVTLTDPKTVSAIAGTTTTVTTPTLKVTPTTISTTVTYAADASDVVTFDVSAANLTAAVTVSSNNANFVPSVTSISKANAHAGYEVSVTWKPSAVGTETGKITLTSGDLSKTVTITGTAEEAPLKFKTGWAFNEVKANANAKGWDATKVRNIAYYNGKLYMVYNQKEIKVVNAQTGEDLGSLSTKGVSGGVITLCDVQVFKGKVYACNIGKTGEGALKIYRWADDHADPEVVLETSDFNVAARVGDCMTFCGDLTTGWVVFANDNGTQTSILEYTITDGKFATKPNVLKALKTDGTQLKTGASTRCYRTTTPLYYITGQHAYTTCLDATGKQSWFIDGNETWGNDFIRFKYKSDTQNYALETVYTELNNTNYMKGQMRLLKKGPSWKESTVVRYVPTAGMSETTSNTSCASSIAVSSDAASTVQVWFSVNGQGVGYYYSEQATLPTYNPEPVGPVTPDPTITLGNAPAFADTYVGETATGTLSVSGKDLVGNISLKLSGDTQYFSISPATVTNNAGTAKAEVTVTYAPTAVGTHTATLTATTAKEDGTKVTKTVTLSAKAIEEVKFNPNIVLSEDWVYSANKGNLAQASWLSTAAPLTRHVAATADKLYVLNSSAWNTPSVAIVSPVDGKQTGTVATTGIAGGENTLAGIEIFDGTLIGANCARTTDAFKVYKWTADNAAPEVMISDATHGEIYAGELISVSGNMASGAIWTSNGSKVLRYNVANGVAEQTPQVIPLTKDGAAYSVGDQKAKAQVVANNDGTMWVLGKDKHPTLFSATGEYISELDRSHIQGAVHGNSGKVFAFGDKTYGAFSTYTQPDSQTLSGGAVALVDMTDAAEPVHLSVQPAEGLGTTRNTDFQTSVSHVLTDNNTKLNLYVAVPNQGVAKYSYSGAVNTGAELVSHEIDLAEAAAVDVYTISGAHIAHSTALPALEKGLYIVRVTYTDGTVKAYKLSK